TRLEHANGFRDHPQRLGDVMEDQKEKRHVHFTVAQRKGFKTSIPEIDVVQSMNTLLRGGKHRVRFVHADDALDEGSERLRDGSRAAAKIRHRPGFVEKSQQRDVRAPSEQLETHSVPLTGGRRKKLL